MSVRERAPAWLALGSALVLAYLAVRPELYVSWTPPDDGVLAQGAERVLRGEVPHRDFVALWSGGLDYLNAAGFRVLGTKLSTLRTVLAGAWLLGLAAFFAAARHLVAARTAGVLTVAVAVWTLPLSPHPLPSWYNLALGLAGVAAVLAFLESGRPAWFAVAGAAAAASVAVKIVGLYFVAANLLLIVWLVQDYVQPTPGRAPSAARPYAWFISAGLLAFLAMVTTLALSVRSTAAIVHFVLPHLALVMILLWREWRLPAGAERARFRCLAGYLLPFAIGAGVVLLVWLTPYLMAGALGDLVRGLFVTPRVRFDVASSPLPGMRSATVAALPFALLLALAPFVRRPLRTADRAALAIVVGVAAGLAYDGSPLVLATWYGLRMLTPLCALLALWWLVAPPRGMEIAPERRPIVFFLVATAVTGSLIQVPFALYTYFLYFLPLLALAVAALAMSQPAMPREVPAALLAFVLLFGVRGPDSLGKRAWEPEGAAPARLALDRGGITVSRDDSATYSALVQAIHRHDPGDWLYVWHDSPQVYFLAGLRNPTRTMYEVFDDSVAQSHGFLSTALTARDVRVVVLTSPVGAVREMDPRFRDWLVGTYPSSERVGSFEVRWR